MAKVISNHNIEAAAVREVNKIFKTLNCKTAEEILEHHDWFLPRVMDALGYSRPDQTLESYHYYVWECDQGGIAMSISEDDPNDHEITFEARNYEGEIIGHITVAP